MTTPAQDELREDDQDHCECCDSHIPDAEQYGDELLPDANGKRVCLPCRMYAKAASKKAEDDRKRLRQEIDVMHDEVYVVWNGASDRLNPLEIGHLESALKSGAKVIAELSSPTERTKE